MILLTTLTVGLIAILLYLVYGIDNWLGILAFTYQYLAFCVLIAGAVAAAWLAKSRRLALTAGLIAFALLVSPYLLRESSSRILRRVLSEVKVGTPADEVERIVTKAYMDSGYAMPRITRTDSRIHVSLLSQEPGDCTAAIFYLDDGLVIRDEFSAD